MPYPAQVTKPQLIEAAWELVEQEGIDQLSLNRLAAVFDVKAPSLYRHMQNKAGLIRAVNELTNTRLIDSLMEAMEAAGDDPADRMIAIGRAYRVFAHAHPRVFMLAFSTAEDTLRPDAAEQERAVLPLQGTMAQISGEADSLAALRGVLALVHGFVVLELNAQFRRGGDLDEAFEKAYSAYLKGWS